MAFFPALAFWGLDGYYLWQKRLYRKLYDKVREINDYNVDFSMDTSSVVKQVSPWICVVFSKTILAFHGTIISTILIVMFIVVAGT